jgi:hypothetical protein
MTPLQFITDASYQYNVPCGAIGEAFNIPIRILDGKHSYEVLSYYYDEESKSMCLDISVIETKKRI